MTATTLEEKSAQLVLLENELKLMDEMYEAGDPGDDELYYAEVKRLADLKSELSYLLLRGIKDDVEKLQIQQRVQLELLHGNEQNNVSKGLDGKPDKAEVEMTTAMTATPATTATTSTNNNNEDVNDPPLSEDEFTALYCNLDPNLNKIRLTKRDLLGMLNSLQGEINQKVSL